MKTRESKKRAGDIDLFGGWPRSLLAFPRLDRWFEDTDFRIEEYREDGTLVVKADLPGLDPEKDVEITISDGQLTIHAERHREEKVEERDYYREEVQYGAFTRTLPVPAGVTEGDVKATYKDGVLEVRVPVREAEQPAVKIPVERG